MNIRIEFDGGSANNNPNIRGGFGNGYGSYKIDSEPIQKRDYPRPMSANSAEILILVDAIRDVTTNFEPQETDLEIIGDSQITLGWVLKCRTGKFKLSNKTTKEFQEAVCRLKLALRDFRIVSATWQPRLKSVATFGH